jgi:hypothetical protein
MAFQLILAELRTHQDELKALQQMVHQMLPLLAKIVRLLEAQGHQPDVPVATWDATYATEEETPVPPVEDAVVSDDTRVHVPFGSRRLARWFFKETPRGDA